MSAATRPPAGGRITVLHLDAFHLVGSADYMAT